MKAFGNIAKDGQVRAVASGALTDGKPVIVNSNGTVSVVAGSPTGTGTVAEFDSDRASFLSAVFDSVNNKVVLCYRDNGNQGKAVVGTVSGTSISFGSIATWTTNNPSSLNAAFDVNSGKVVITYRDSSNSSYGTAVIGTVSGTSISFGSPVVFQSVSTLDPFPSYDSNAQKTVIFYHDNTNATPEGIVGTVSGTSIPFGSPTIIESGLGSRTLFWAAFDTTNNKHIVTYKNGYDSNHGYAVVATVSGTSVSFGTSAEFLAATLSYSTVNYDPTSGKGFLAYKASGVGYGQTATISGTSISFGTAVAITGSSGPSYIKAIYDPDNDNMVLTWTDTGTTRQTYVGLASISGTAVSFSSVGALTSFPSGEYMFINAMTYDTNENQIVQAYTYFDGGSPYPSKGNVIFVGSTNLTSENFIGFSDGAFADTQSAVINTANTIDRNQSSLTAGQTLFVQTDGTLGETAADPSVTAGTAISATEIIVKG